MKSVVILHSPVGALATEDEKDTLVQAEAIRQSLIELEYEPHLIPFSLNLDALSTTLKSINPVFAVNLVESEGKIIHISPSLLTYLRIPYTGNSASAILLTTDKLLTKKILYSNNLPTPAWITLDSTDLPNKQACSQWIIKSRCEDASINLTDESVINTNSIATIKTEIRNRNKQFHDEFFAEAYIEGREINVSIISDKQGATVFPVAEIQFVDYPANKLKIVNYNAKWNEEAFEYTHTDRTFQFSPKDQAMLQQLREIALSCWQCFGLNGYARVDFRVNNLRQPTILEINPNPGIATESGFIAAAEQAGLSYTQVIQRLIEYLAN